MIKTWAVTDTGLVRKENQDTYRIARNGDICVVCDGMGGAAGGRLASTLASETYAAEMEKALKPDMTPEQLREASAYAVAMANRAVAERAEAEAALANMGTTLVAAVAYENGVVITNVGDSRAYLAGAQGLRQISRDHSLVEDMVEKGDLTPGQARSHPRRNLITRALGPDPAVEADDFAIQWKAGDFLLLCSDGLVNTVTDQEIMFEILHNGQPEDCLQRLMAISKQRGAPDNVTAILLMND
mgnify:CR=1 FL=1